MQFYNERSPCTRPQTHGVPTSAYLGGKSIQVHLWGGGAFTEIKGTAIQTGPVVIRWSCRDVTGTEVESHYEWKGDVYRLGDPSGTVVDRLDEGALDVAGLGMVSISG